MQKSHPGNFFAFTEFLLGGGRRRKERGTVTQVTTFRAIRKWTPCNSKKKRRERDKGRERERERENERERERKRGRERERKLPCVSGAAQLSGRVSLSCPFLSHHVSLCLSCLSSPLLSSPLLSSPLLSSPLLSSPLLSSPLLSSPLLSSPLLSSSCLWRSVCSSSCLSVRLSVTKQGVEQTVRWRV